MAFKRMKPVRPAASAPIESRIVSELRRAEGLKERGRLDDAFEVAESLHLKYPKRKEPLLYIMDMASETGNTIVFEDTLERLLEIVPDNPEYVLTQAKMAGANAYAGLALERFNRFLERWPRHEQAGPVREIVRLLESDLAEMLDEAGILHADRFYLEARNDEIYSLIERERFDEARAMARQVLDREPTHVPILNNYSMLLLLQAKWQEATLYSERVLEANPENIFALASLARANEMLGYKAEAALYAKRLKSGRAPLGEKAAKALEALSYLGDDAGVLEVYQRALEEKDEAVLESSMTHHLAGAAAMRLGQEEKARRYWKEALKQDPDFELTKENLANLKQPTGKRDTPWAFSLGYWVPVDLLEQLVTQIPVSIQDSDDDVAQDVSRSILATCPWIEALVPILLERGDPAGRQFALMLANTLKTPAMLAAVQDFAQSQYGSDQMRIEAANLVVEAGVVPGRRMRMWVRGEWEDVGLMDWEIHNETAGAHSPRVEKLLKDAVAAMYAGNSSRSETLLKKALEIEPDAPDILNNLANTYKSEGRIQEAVQAMTEISERFPDYFFGKINMAQLSLDEGRLEDAEKQLEPLLSRKRLHSGEFAALAQTHIQFYFAQNEPEAARHWYDMWRQAVPNHPGLARFSPLFEAPPPAVRRIGRRTRTD